MKLARTLLLALASLLPHAPQAQPAEPLPLVGPWGIGTPRPTRSAVLAELGAPESVEVAAVTGTSGRARMGSGDPGGHETLRYPSRGVFLIIDRQDRDARDPPIRRLWFTPPAAAGATREGLHLGQAEAQVLAIVQRDFEVLADRPGAAAGERSLVLADPRGQRRTQVSLFLQRGRLQGLGFDFHPPLPAWQRYALAALMLVVAGSAAWAAERWWRRHAITVPVASDRTTAMVSRLFVLAGAVLGALALAACAWLAVVAATGGAAGFAGLVWVGSAYHALAALALAGVLLAVGWRIRP